MDRFTIRRNLLRGSLSAPLVLTVSSAGAARTTFAVCFVERTDEPTLKAADFDGSWGDSWFRIEIPGRRKPNDSIYYIQYPSAYRGDDKWYTALLDSMKVFALDLSVPALASPPAEATEVVKVAALALFEPTDATGTPRRIAFSDQTGSITTKSCHASVF